MSVNVLLKAGFDRLGYTYEYLKRITTDLYAGTYLFRDEDKTVMALKRIREDGRKIAVWPDFDVDGISAGCILYGGLSLMGFDVVILPPSTRNGYGMQFADADRLLAEHPDVAAVITCDVGIGAWDVIAYLQSMDIDVYVTDHHPEKSRSSADVVMDPSRLDDDSPFKGVCGAFVAWHLMTLYSRLACTPDIQALVDKLVLFAGLGSVGDSMPVTHDTRSAIKASVIEMNALLDCEDIGDYFGVDPETLPDAYVAPFDNLRALHYHLLRDNKIQTGDVDDETYGFKYCPIFNCYKRLGGDMAELYRFLYVRYEWNSDERLLLCSRLADQNEYRKNLSRQLFETMREGEQPWAPYVFVIDAFAGMLGPLASKMMEQTGLPCVVVRPSGDGYKGSGRTPEWFDCTGVFSEGGCSADGHEHAFGIAVGADAMDGLYERMAAASAARPSSGHDGLDTCVRVCVNGHAPGARYDLSVSRVDDHDVLMDYATSLKNYRPFGEGLEEPLFLLSFAKSDIDGFRAMGSDRSHLRLNLAHNVTAIWFSNAKFMDDIAGDPDSTVYTLSGRFGLDVYNNSVSLRFMVSGRV